MACLRFCMCVLLIPFTDSQLFIDVEPVDILPGLTPELVIICSLSINHFEDLDVIKSLTLSRYNDATQTFGVLLVLDTATLGVQRLVELDDVQVSSGSLFVALTVRNPEEKDAQVYRCNANGINSEAKNHSITETKTVQDKRSLTDYTKEIERLKTKGPYKIDIDAAEENQNASAKVNDVDLESGLTFKLMPEVVKEHILPMSIHCSFTVSYNDTNTNLKIRLLYIRHESNGIVATISEDQDAKDYQEPLKLVSGNLNGGNLSEPSLQVTWTKPSFSLSGNYFCGAHTVNNRGDERRYNARLTVTVEETKLEDLASIVSDLRQQVNEFQEEQETNKGREINSALSIERVIDNLTSVETYWKKKFDEDILPMKNEIRKIIADQEMMDIAPYVCHDVESTEDRVVVTLPSGLKIMCDTKTEGGGWIIFQRRINGKVDFYRGWKEYRDGFGDFNIGEFYLGNEIIFKLTTKRKYKLRIDLKYGNTAYFAQYSDFKLLGENNKFKLKIGTYSGNAGDSLKRHHNKYFTTFDKNNDRTGRHCSKIRHGAWWYDGCSDSNLNGNWGRAEPDGLYWDTIVYWTSVSFSEMKIRVSE
uniref:Fibrinogen C-terminal domain-containing protein n=1 Tax=Biomphalaria glabrata TaxID=6526 RepID=A0A2C9JT09_BIOGL